MKKVQIIQFFINLIGANSYLEIGSSEGRTFNQIKCRKKIGVDSVYLATHQMTSDKFFEQNSDLFDVIFIDGLHESEQVYRDINNSLKILNKHGYIICHDMNPESEIMQRYPRPFQQREWTGDCWKAWVRLRREREDLFMCVLDCDYGCGVIKKGLQVLLTDNLELTYKNFVVNKERWLNLI